MATTEAAVADNQGHSDHGHDHDHPPFLAHHFDTPEQQFDSGKLGIWIFLVTEVLFFSGMFCAYAIFRMLRPDVFEGSSQFLNTQLGAINTGVLLFSSLTMAWAVRCSQTEEHTKLTALLATTLSCGMVFLGVKAVEYSHKWSMGLLPGKFFAFDPANPHPEGGPNFLLWIMFPFILLALGTLLWLAVSVVRKKEFQVACAKPLSVVCLSFFLGVVLGMILESDDGHGDEAHADHHGAVHEAAEVTDPSADLVIGSPLMRRLAEDETNSGVRSELRAREIQKRLSGEVGLGAVPQEAAIADVGADVLTPRTAGVFFGIYYSMTGIHAIHILAGLGVLVWLLVRSVRLDFHRHSFGPVDYVGLYWHLVDLIWIYLFPLLYLIR